MNSKVIINFIKLLKTDCCLLFYMLGFMMTNVTVTQLMEDKMCLNELHLSSEFCSTLTSLHANETSTKLILQNANQFKNWQFIILNIPALVLSVFLGYWLGNYPKYIKFMIILPLASASTMVGLLLVNTFAFSLSWPIILLSYLPAALGGGTFLIFSAAYTYISWSTPPHLAVIRFAVLEFLIQSGVLIATYTGGKVLSMDPWIKGQPKNYGGVFILSLVCFLVGLAYAFYMELEFTPKTEPDKDVLSFVQVVSNVFKVERFKQPVKIFLRKRPNKGRARLFLLIASSAVSLGSVLGEDGIAYQFAQKMYGLSQDEYTSLYSLLCISPAIATTLGPPLFKSFLGLSDSMIAILGCVSAIIFFSVRGLVLSLPGYIAGYVVGCFCRTVNPSIKALISHIVDPDEAAQVFSLASAFENYIALASTLFYTSVFSATIDRSPGSVLLLIASFGLFPLAVVCWVEFTRSKWQIKSNDIETSPVEAPPIIESVTATLETPKNDDPITH